MKKSRNSLSDALARAANGPTSAKNRPRPPEEGGARRNESKRVGADPQSAKAYRAGRVNVTGYFDPDVKKSIRLIQAKHPDRTVQDLLAEALNDLFAKYNVPQSAHLR